MTRTLLTEKKEGEENIGGVEWLQIKENDFSYRPSMICNFLHQHEDDDAVAPDPDKSLELEEHEIQMKDNQTWLMNRRNHRTWKQRILVLLLISLLLRQKGLFLWILKKPP